MKRGYVFTLDGVVAVSIAILAMMALIFILGSPSYETYFQIPLHRTAQEILTVLDKNGTFKKSFGPGFTNSALNDSIKEILPPNMNARINLTIYTFNDPTFTLTNTFAFTVYPGSEPEIKASARRIFAYANASKYGLAVLEVWYR